LFSYRHAFHAGNHADVLKHVVLLQVLDYLNQKDSPWWLIDTHAGAGIYDLCSRWARQSGEAQSGVLRLLHADGVDELVNDKVPAPVQRYLHALQACNPADSMHWYAGSPWLALHAMRPQDRLRLFELHPNEADILAHNLRCLPPRQQRRIEMRQADGFKGVTALLPPPSRRGLVLLDPSYENKQDYRHLLHTLQAALKRFAHGSYFIWHPLVQRPEVAKEIEKLVKNLKVLTPGDWLHVTLQVAKPSAGHGLHGSGVFLINPPWTLAATLRLTLPWLTRVLAQDGQAGYRIQEASPRACRP